MPRCCSLVAARRVCIALAQPRNQELLQQALGSSSDVVSTSAASTLLKLWSKVTDSGSTAATLPAHADALRLAARALQHGSDSAKASAAEFCWLASKQHNGSESLLMHDAATALAAALTAAEPTPCGVFALAALCNVRAKLLEDQHALPATLQLWLFGSSLQDELFHAYCELQMVEETAEELAAAAAQAAATGTAAEAGAARHEAALWAAKAARFQEAAEVLDAQRKTLQHALPQAAVLLRCVLQALGCFGTHERLAAAAHVALSFVLQRAEHALLRPALQLLHEQSNQQQQQTAEDRCAEQAQPQSVVQLLLDAAPDLAALAQSRSDLPSFDIRIPEAATAAGTWAGVVARAPEAVTDAVVARLQEQLLSAAAGSSGTGSSGTAASSSSSSSMGSCSGCEVASYEGHERKEPFWGCCSVATSRTSNRPRSTSSAAHNACELLRALLAVLPARSLLQPGWKRVIFDVDAKALTLVKDAAAADALVKLQHALLLQLACAVRSLPDAVQQLVHAALQQQLHAAIAGDSDAFKLVERFVSEGFGRKQLLQHVPTLVSVLQAQPWLQQPQQQHDDEALQQQEKQQKEEP
jgi:hypothetical protein